MSWDRLDHPYVAFRPAARGEDAGESVGAALDALVVWAKERGATDNDLHERLEESLDRAEAAARQ
jgi:hypothetical protein